VSLQASAQAISVATMGDELSLITVPRRAECPSSLVDALGDFDAGARPAAVATSHWLRESAMNEHDSARTYLWVARGRVHGFFAISVGSGRLQPETLTELDAGPRPLPAVLLAQAARWPESELLPAGAILSGALGVAERIAQYAGVGALMLDPFDDPTSAMWQRRGFQPVLDTPPRGRPRRLWRALGS